MCDYSGSRANLLTSKEQSDRQTDRQTQNSNTEATLILCGYSGSRANKRGDSTTERRMRTTKMRKFAYKQSKNNQTDRQTDTKFKH